MKSILFATAATLALAGTAQAGEMKTETTMTSQTIVIPAERLDGPIITVVPNTQFEVLGAVERDGGTVYAIPVQNEVFYNHVPADLTEIVTDVDEVDSFTYEYRGMTFTNRIVENGTRGEVDGFEPGAPIG